MAPSRSITLITRLRSRTIETSPGCPRDRHGTAAHENGHCYCADEIDGREFGLYESQPDGCGADGGRGCDGAADCGGDGATESTDAGFDVAGGVRGVWKEEEGK